MRYSKAKADYAQYVLHDPRETSALIMTMLRDVLGVYSAPIATGIASDVIAMLISYRESRTI